MNCDKTKKYLRDLNEFLSKKRQNDESIPVLESRIPELFFCNHFEYTDIAKKNEAIDCYIPNSKAAGIKTFTKWTITNSKKNGKVLKEKKYSYEKIAEMGKISKGFISMNVYEMVITISEERNRRITHVENKYNLNDLYYHCIVRSPSYFEIYEYPMDKIDINNIIIDKENETTIYFHDNLNYYKFSKTKNTLYKKFILSNPKHKVEFNKKEEDYVILPLFSVKTKTCPERSQLNQRFAKGRTRNEFEVYISIPSWIHQKSPDFFPRTVNQQNDIFSLRYENQIFQAKVCQDGGKALMSKPNDVLGKILLSKILQINSKSKLKYSDLIKRNIDSVKISKNNGIYTIEACGLGTYDNFELENRHKYDLT